MKEEQKIMNTLLQSPSCVCPFQSIYQYYSRINLNIKLSTTTQSWTTACQHRYLNNSHCKIFILPSKYNHHYLAIYQYHIINKSGKYQLSMTSSYSMRKRVCPRTPETKPQLFKVFQLSPKSSIKDPIPYSNKKQINSNKSISKITTANATPQLQIEARTNVINQSNGINHEHCSSSLNQSSLGREKNAQLQLAFEKPEDNAMSMGVENNSIFMFPEGQKLLRKNSEGHYQEDKKSYRKHRYGVALGVPYRKCHSSMQEKIVNIINKIKSGKQCFKQIQTLLERAKKVSIKELSNKFFVSGLFVIHRLVSEIPNCPSSSTMTLKIQEVIQELKIRIFEELDSIKAFQTPAEIPDTKINYDKAILIRKAYKILMKKNRNQSKLKLQEQAIQISEKFIESQPRNLDAFWMSLSQL